MASYYEIWNSNPEDNNSDTIYYIPYKYGEVWELEKRLWNPTFTHQMFTRHWHWSIPIVLVYIAGNFLDDIIDNGF